MPKDDGKKCAECVYYAPGGKAENSGQCRRFPPPTVSGWWPEVFGHDWCGEFSQRIADDPTPLDDLEFSVRAKNVFDRQGLKTVGDLVRLSVIEVMAFPNVGHTTVMEIRKRLGERKRHLRGDPIV